MGTISSSTTTFGGNVGSSYMGDDITPYYPGTGDRYVGLSTIGLVSWWYATVILTTEVISGNLNCAGVPANTWNDRVFQVQGRKAHSYGNGIQYSTRF